MKDQRLCSFRMAAALTFLLALPIYASVDSGLTYGNPSIELDTARPMTFYDSEKTKVKTGYLLGRPKVILKPLGIEAVLGCYYASCSPSGNEELVGFYESGALKFAAMSRPQRLFIGDSSSTQPQKGVNVEDAHMNPLVFSETGELAWVPTDSAEMKGQDRLIKLKGIRPKKGLGVPTFAGSLKLHPGGSVQVACIRWDFEPVRIITLKGTVTIPAETSAILYFREDGIVEKWTTGSCDE